MKQKFSGFHKVGDRGAALITVLTAATIGVLLVMGTISSVIYLNRYVHSTNLDDTQEMMAKQIRLILSDPEVCSTLFHDVDLGSALSNAAAPNENANSNVPLRARVSVPVNGVNFTFQDPRGTPIPLPGTPGLVLTKFKLQFHSVTQNLVSYAGPPAPSTNFGSANDLRAASIWVGIQKTGDAFATKKTIQIPISVLLQGGLSSGALKYCAADSDEGAICRQMGNAWVPFDLGNNRKCVTQNSCLKGGYFSDGLPSEGGFVNAITGGKSCPTGYTIRRVGSIAYSASCGKNCVTNLYNAVYECIACNTGIGTPLALAADPVTGNPITSGLNFDAYESAAGGQLDYNSNVIGAISGNMPIPTPTPAPTPMPTATPTPTPTAVPGGNGSTPIPTPTPTATPGSGGSCTLRGVTVLDNQSRAFYDTPSGTTGCDPCNVHRMTRTCNNGVLSGNSAYEYPTCTNHNPAGNGGPRRPTMPNEPCT